MPTVQRVGLSCIYDSTAGSCEVQSRRVVLDADGFIKTAELPQGLGAVHDSRALDAASIKHKRLKSHFSGFAVVDRVSNGLAVLIDRIHASANAVDIGVGFEVSDLAFRFVTKPPIIRGQITEVLALRKAQAFVQGWNETDIRLTNEPKAVHIGESLDDLGTTVPRIVVEDDELAVLVGLVQRGFDRPLDKATWFQHTTTWVTFGGIGDRSWLRQARRQAAYLLTKGRHKVERPRAAKTVAPRDMGSTCVARQLLGRSRSLRFGNLWHPSQHQNDPVDVDHGSERHRSRVGLRVPGA